MLDEGAPSARTRIRFKGFVLVFSLGKLETSLCHLALFLRKEFRSWHKFAAHKFLSFKACV